MDCKLNYDKLTTQINIVYNRTSKSISNYELRFERGLEHLYFSKKRSYKFFIPQSSRKFLSIAYHFLKQGIAFAPSITTFSVHS